MRSAEPHRHARARPRRVWGAAAPIVQRAGDLAEQQRFRGYDAVHLATALASGADVMVTADTDLLRAGPVCGIRILYARG